MRFRPYDSWTDKEWSIFFNTMQANGRPIYLLDDGGDMAEICPAGTNSPHSEAY